MRLVSFKSSGVVRIGAVVGDTVVHLNGLLPGAERIPDDMTAFLTAGEPAMAAARKAVEAFKRGEHLALPYYEVFASDPDKLTRLSDAYRALRAGSIDADELPERAAPCSRRTSS